MEKYDIKLLPQSFGYGEIIKNIKPNEVAFCFSGSDNKNAILFKSKEGSILMFLPNKDEIERKENFELWAFVHQIPNGVIRQNAINRWFEVFNIFDDYLGLEEYKFKL